MASGAEKTHMQSILKLQSKMVMYTTNYNQLTAKIQNSDRENHRTLIAKKEIEELEPDKDIFFSCGKAFLKETKENILGQLTSISEKSETDKTSAIAHRQYLETVIASCNKELESVVSNKPK